MAEECDHDKRFGSVFNLPKEDHGCVACAFEHLTTKFDGLHRAAENLMKQYNIVAESPEWKGIWVHLAVHNNEYSGPQFGDELTALEAELDKLK